MRFSGHRNDKTVVFSAGAARFHAPMSATYLHVGDRL